MSTQVKDIQDAGKTLIGSILTGYDELEYAYDIEKNNFNTNTNRYGFIPFEADFVEGRLLQHVSLDHRFQVIITEEYFNQDDDAKQQLAVTHIYEKQHNVLKELVKNKIGAILVRGVNFDEPEFIEGKVCAIKMNVIVRYRYNVL